MSVRKLNLNKLTILVAAALVIVAAVSSGIYIKKFLPQKSLPVVSQKLVNEQSDVIDVVKKVGPSVVTVSAIAPTRPVIQFSPFGGFNQGTTGGGPQDIGSGFAVSTNGLIVTNKHVVSDTSLAYKVETPDGKSYDVKQIDRDPNNDIAILKIDATELIPVTLGDSGNLQVGQFVIAIGTALGQFRNTVTTGVVSGLGRGIDAGDSLQGYVERLDNVIQTDAAINPGNSGGPLLDSSGQVIGINVAVAQGANNIAFSIPINTVKDALNQYQTNGKFPAKAYLGVEYQMISKQVALLNNVPQGAYVVSVVSGSPAEKMGLQNGDIIYKFDGQTLDGSSGGLAKLISGKKVGDSVKLNIWRNGQQETLNITLSEAKQ